MINEWEARRKEIDLGNVEVIKKNSHQGLDPLRADGLMGKQTCMRSTIRSGGKGAPIPPPTSLLLSSRTELAESNPSFVRKALPSPQVERPLRARLVLLLTSHKGQLAGWSG